MRWIATVAFTLALAACHGDRSGATGDVVPPIDTSGTILFGDLHAHTTLSLDAQVFALNFLKGVGFALPAEACAFARHCADLDFWSINDHAELILPDEWQATKEAIRACNAAWELPAEAPEMVSFLGWEWTQSDVDPARHYGHKNVVLRETADDGVPVRPIGYSDWIGWFLGGIGEPEEVADDALDVLARTAAKREPEPDSGIDLLLDMVGRMVAGAGFARCPEGVAVRDLPADCVEVAERPRDLYAKLDDWGYPHLLIPHGMSWGLTSPPFARWGDVLATPDLDPARERLLEIYSGHGSSEQWKPNLPYVEGGGDPRCPAPTADYEPCCWRAGEIARSREPACRDDPGAPTCEAAVEEVRQLFIAGGHQGIGRVAARYAGDAPVAEEWLDCGHCRSCDFNPPNLHLPSSSAQAALATTAFAAPGDARRLRFGFIGSTDEHSGTPGIGYKEVKDLTDILAFQDADLHVAWQRLGIFANANFQNSSFYFSGALVGAHTTGRTRAQIWDALERKRVYATSGKRILLWFDVVAPELARPAVMGESVPLAGTPTFRAKALGDWEQLPGCPEDVIDAVGAAFVDEVCLGECYHPGARRRAIDRIEVVRIRPQIAPDERFEALIEDPWRVIPCPPDPGGCEVEFADADYPGSGRPAVYYVRALEEAEPVFNGAQQRCAAIDAGGSCTAVDLCHGGALGAGDDCLAPAQHRAWSSPIFLDPPEGA